MKITYDQADAAIDAWKQLADLAFPLAGGISERTAIASALRPVVLEVPHMLTVIEKLSEVENEDGFRQEISDQVKYLMAALDRMVLSNASQSIANDIRAIFSRYIIAKPDPLIDAIQEADEVETGWARASDYAEHLRAALAKRGLKIVEVE